MSPQVESAIIAGCFGVLTLIGTLVTQVLGRRATSQDTQKHLMNKVSNSTERSRAVGGVKAVRTLGALVITWARELCGLEDCGTAAELLAEMRKRVSSQP